jgi:RNA polymerase sigma-70 factor (ECF subfamily)
MPPDALWSEDEDMMRHLPVCMDGLGPSAREAIELQYRGERKLADIGKQLHRSEGAVKLLLHRARQALKDCLDRRKRQAAHGT